MKNQIKGKKGITLIALVITIIVLLILAGVAIATLTGDNGLLQKVSSAKQENKEAKELELIKLAVSAAQVDGEGTITINNINQELQNIFNNKETVIGNENSNYYFYKKYRIYRDGRVEEGNVLPDEYKQVEYLESTGTQWIDTGILGISETDEFSFVASYENELDGYNMFGWDDGNEYYDVNLRHKDFNNVSQLAWGKIYGNNWLNTSNVLEVGTAHRFATKTEENELLFEVDDIEIGKINTSSCSKNQSHGLFARLRDRAPRLYGESKVYEFKYWRDGVLIRNYIPCYCISTVTNLNGKQCQSGTRGVYDLVTGEFYTNQNTTTGRDFKIPGE